MNAKVKLAALLGAAVLAVPGAAVVGNAVAADGSSSAAQAPALTPVQDSQPEQQERPDRDCPEKGGSGSSASAGTATAL